MKYKNAILGVAILAVLAGAANAGTNTMGLTGGLGIPTGNYGDAAAKGWQIGAVGTHMVNTQWGFGGDVAYHGWGGSDALNSLVQPAGGSFKWSAIQATAHAVMAFPTTSNAKPYAKVGAGLYNVDLKLSSPVGNTSESKSEFGFNVGGGVNFLTKSNMQWGLSGAYHIVPIKDDPNSAISLLTKNVNFFQVGVNVLWGSR